MKPNISEFSYGFALTTELINVPGMPVSAAPVFPNLYQEGQVGGGWDVQLNYPGIPLFLQFKLSDYMRVRSCREFKYGGMSVPCYRVHLRPSSKSEQHEMLVELEQSGQEVYYAAPAFHEPHELNDAFLTQNVCQRSFWFRPTQIGLLPDDGDHHVSFETSGAWKFFSEPQAIDGPNDFPALQNRIVGTLRDRGSKALERQSLEILAEKVVQIAERRPDISRTEKDFARAVLDEVQPIKRIAYYASVFLESQLFVAREKAEA